jgi:hypothetical protein
LKLKTSEEAGIDLSILKWKPITPEQFAGRVADASLEANDEFGNGEQSTKTVYHGNELVTVFYVPKELDSPVSRPYALCYRTKGKFLYFEYLNLLEK